MVTEMKKGIMKKMVAVGMMIAVTATVMTACGNKEYTVSDLTKMKVEKYVTLPEYKGLEVSVDPQQEVTDADITYYIQNKMNDNDAFHDTTSKVADGNLVNISYVGTVDGKAFDGGTADDQLLQIGSHSYIDGFEEGLIGAKAGDTVSLNLKFPDDYSSTDLAGKACVFNVTINYIVAPLSDENVNKVDSDYKDAASYQAAVKTMLENYVQTQYKSSVKSAISSKLLEGCTFKNIPDSLVASFKDELTKSLTAAAKNYSMDLNTYLEQRYSIAATDVDKTIDSMAEKCAEEGLALQAIANAEKLNVTDDDLTAEMNTEASKAGYTSVDEYLGTDGDQEDFRVNMMYDKVYDFLIKNAKITTTDAAATGSTEAAGSTAAASTEAAAGTTAASTAAESTAAASTTAK